MQIDITGSDLQTFLSLAQKFPSGKIIAKNGKAYWDFGGQLQQVAQTPQPIQYAPQAQPPQPQKQGNAFFNMFDSMADRF